MTAFYAFFIRLGERFSDWLLLFIRLFWGLQFAQAGWMKIQNMSTTITSFKNLHIPLYEFAAPTVGWVELICGLALALGFLSRIITIPLIITMIVALFTAHIAFIYAPLTVVHEAPFNFLLASLIVFCFGAGRFSLDNLMMIRH